MLLTVQLPSGATAQLAVAPNTLVFDGEGFNQPWAIDYAELYSFPVSAPSMPYKEFPSQVLSTAVRIKARVLNVDNTDESTTDPSLVTQPDPSEGQCICGLTCSGTEIRFAVVQLEN
jgi:hypothetical protein